MAKQKKENSKLSGVKFTKGLLFGSFLGATIAILNAPKSGKKTRQTIVNNVTETKDAIQNVKTSFDYLQDDVEYLETMVGERLPEFVNGTKKSVRAFQFKAKPRISDIKSQIKKIKAELDDFSNT